MTKTKLDEALAEIEVDFSWDDWIDEDASIGGRTRYMKITDVLYTRLEWIAEELKDEKSDENEKHLETIVMVQKLLAAVESENN